MRKYSSFILNAIFVVTAKIALLTGLAFVFVGCASATHQTDALLQKEATAWPAKAFIEGVPFIEQAAGHCGPATLTMALQFYGKTITVDHLAPQVYTPGVEGSFQADMISATRRQGMIAIPIEGMETLLKEVAAGHPVVVFENLALTWLPQWHYAIVFGYDLKAQTVQMHSGPEKLKNWDIRKFERSWKLADYWGLLVLPPGKLSATADELSHVKATAALESLGKKTEAKKSYQSILEKWPESLAANIGSANIAFADGKHSEATRFLEVATKHHPQVGIAWHNLTIAYGAAKNLTKARQSAAQALKWASEEEKAAFAKNLKAWL